jgi:hypothetical protein
MGLWADLADSTDPRKHPVIGRPARLLGLPHLSSRPGPTRWASISSNRPLQDNPPSPLRHRVYLFNDTSPWYGPPDRSAGEV